MDGRGLGHYAPLSFRQWGAPSVGAYQRWRPMLQMLTLSNDFWQAVLSRILLLISFLIRI
jgi:hypothetical protein